MKGWNDGLKDRAVLSLMENIYAKGSDECAKCANTFLCTCKIPVFEELDAVI